METNQLTDTTADNAESANEMIYTALSPFVYHDGLILRRYDSPKDVSYAYLKKCVETNRINDFDLDVLREVYNFGCINKHCLEILFNKPEKSLKRCISKLVRNGFLTRNYCVYTDGTQNRQTPYFYTCCEGVLTYFRTLRIGRGATAPNDPVLALKKLALNQFIVSCREYRDKIITETYDSTLAVGNYVVSVPYSVVMEGVSSRNKLYPVIVRRDNSSAASVISQLKVILGTVQDKNVTPVPICICEDMPHVLDLYIMLSKDTLLSKKTIAFNFDLALLGGGMLERLLVCLEPDADKIQFTQVSLCKK